MFSEENKKIMPLIVTIIICSAIMVLSYIWSNKQMEIIARDAVFVPVREEIPVPKVTRSTFIVPEDGMEAYRSESIEFYADEIKKLTQTHSKDKKDLKDHGSSKYNIYPSKEELEAMKKNDILMY
jgi:hypothetical protein